MNFDLAAVLALVNSAEFDEAIGVIRTALETDWKERARVLKSDVQRIRFFELCCAKHLGEMVAEGKRLHDIGDELALGQHVRQVVSFIGGWSNIHDRYWRQIEDLTKFQFPKDVFGGKWRNPFKDEREMVNDFVRVFAVDVRGVRF